MVTTQFTLYGDCIDWFEQLKREVGEQRGFEPTNNELLRLMMAQVSLDSDRGRTV